MYVVKRNGTHEPVQFDKIQSRLETLKTEQNLTNVDAASLAQTVVSGLYAGVTTEELDTLAAETSASRTYIHPDYSKMAAAISASNLHKKLKFEPFSVKIAKLAAYVHPITNKPAPLISTKHAQIVADHAQALDNAIDYTHDYTFRYFGLKTLENAYLLKMNNTVAMTPQDLLMRLALGMWGDNIEMVLKVYNDLSLKKYIHATPSLFNAATPRPQMSSCFLQTVKSDSIDGIFDTLKDCAIISKYAGGIGLSIHKIRASDSYIAGTGGISNGLVPMLRVFNDTARYVDQVCTNAFLIAHACVHLCA